MADEPVDPLAGWDGLVDPETDAWHEAAMRAEYHADMAEKAAYEAVERNLTETERRHREVDDLLRGCIRLAAEWHRRDPSQSISDRLFEVGDWLGIRCNDWSAFPEHVALLAKRFTPYKYDHHNPELRAIRLAMTKL